MFITEIVRFLYFSRILAISHGNRQNVLSRCWFGFFRRKHGALFCKVVKNVFQFIGSNVVYPPFGLEYFPSYFWSETFYTFYWFALFSLNFCIAFKKGYVAWVFFFFWIFLNAKYILLIENNRFLFYEWFFFQIVLLYKKRRFLK